MDMIELSGMTDSPVDGRDGPEAGGADLFQGAGRGRRWHVV